MEFMISWVITSSYDNFGDMDVLVLK